jgi:hypothetical protein
LAIVGTRWYPYPGKEDGGNRKRKEGKRQLKKRIKMGWGKQQINLSEERVRIGKEAGNDKV